jgi:hypothetical protein
VGHLRARRARVAGGHVDFEVDAGVAVLERTPRVMSTLLRGLPEAWVRASEGPDTWSPFDVIGHLIHGEKTDWIRRARLILEHGETRAFERFDMTAHFSASAGRTLASLLDEFAALREANLETLRGWKLTRAQLELRGTHPALGSVTLGQHLATWVAHDLDHVSQIVRVMARQYGDAVGPWKAYQRSSGPSRERRLRRRKSAAAPTL